MVERARRRSAGPLVHVVGTRPNIVKAAPVVNALARRGMRQVVVHTGQHHDAALSDVFFRDLALPAPDVQLRIRAATGMRRLGRLMAGLERTLGELQPAAVVLYGDVDSTLAGALAAHGLGLPIAHVEAGLRSFDTSMPEEINRRVTDMLAELLFATSPEAMPNLAAEGIDTARVDHVGNPMIDSLLANLGRLDSQAARNRFGLDDRYAVATLHRQSNVDRADDAQRAVEALATVAAQLPVVVPLHPRGRCRLAQAGLRRVAGLRVVEPLGYLEFMSLVRDATLVVTDSGGVQEETTMLNVPCLTLRPNTERPITISHGTNQLVSAATLGAAVDDVLSGRAAFPDQRPPFWDGRAGERIAERLAVFLEHG